MNPSVSKELSKLVTESRKVLTRKRIDFQRVHVIYLKMNYLLSKLDTDKVSERQ